MSKSPRKSIVASFGLLSAELESDQAADQQQPSQTPAPAPGNRVGAGVIGAAHRAIDDIRTERDRLKAIVEFGRWCGSRVGSVTHRPLPLSGQAAGR